MKTKLYIYLQPNYLTPRTAIVRERKQFIKIVFAVHLSAVIPAERYRSDSGALKSAVLNFVFFVMLKNKIEQSACQSCLKNNLLEVFPLTVGSGKTMAFENRRGKYKELGKKVPQAYRVYVEETFLPCDAGDARIFSKEHEHGLRVSKHIFVGNSRLVTAMTHADNNGDTTEQTEKRYYYHADHLQSAQFITNAKGEQYEHIEYTPYGELWIEETAPGIDKLPFRFTGKELDEETGLYYYEARYLDPKYSRWLSGDPALNDYIPKAPINDEAKKHNENLPGMGGIYNTVNLHVYHYAGNNPIKYIDPDGKQTKGADINLHTPQTLDYKASMYIDKPNNFFIVSAHGSVREVFDHSGDPPNNSIGGKEPMKPSELAKLIRNYPKYKKGMTIQLIVCNVGLPNPKAKGIPYAQQLADELGEGVKVLAPEGLVILSFDEKKFKTRYIVEVENNNESKIIYKFKEFIGNQKKDVVE